MEQGWPIPLHIDIETSLRERVENISLSQSKLKGKWEIETAIYALLKVLIS